ncbi:MAG TPA: hypothetical protein VG370_13600 [Chloroflexota bacterium]|jgi:hypothetical protein|nr:hypothetical protein [Chloroflexota bacterium]
MITATTGGARRRSRKRVGVVTPKEFCRALWERRRVLAGPSTPLGIQTLQLGILLTHFIRQNPDPLDFEERLEEILQDERPRRALLRRAAKQTLRAWRAQRWDRLGDGTLVLADTPGRQS